MSTMMPRRGDNQCGNRGASTLFRAQIFDAQLRSGGSVEEVLFEGIHNGEMASVAALIDAMTEVEPDGINGEVSLKSSEL